MNATTTGAYGKGDEKHLDGKEFTFLAENFAHAAEMILNAKKWMFSSQSILTHSFYSSSHYWYKLYRTMCFENK